MSNLNLSVFTSTKDVRINNEQKPLLGKEFHLDEDGQIKKHSNALLVEGTVESISISNLQDLLSKINGLTHSQAISVGKNNTAFTRIVTTRKAANQPNFDDCITRTKEYFSFTSSPSLMMLDYDDGKYTIDELRSELIDLMPELGDCEMLMIQSSSSCIYKEFEEVPANKTGGIHTYIVVDDGTKIPQVGEWLKYAAWQKGHGYHKVTKDGKLLARHLLDDTVYSPERLIFESFPILGEGISSLEREYRYWKGGTLVTQNMALSVSEQRDLEQIIAQNKLQYVDESKIARNKFVNHLEKQMVEFGLTESEAINSVKKLMSDQHFLPARLQLKSAEGIYSVHEVINNIDEHLHHVFVDPFEDDTSNEYRAKLFKNEDGSIIMHSFRHGGTNYCLKGKCWQKILDKHIEEFNKEYAFVVYNSNTFIMKTILNELGHKERIFFRNRDFNDMHCNDMIQIDERINERTQESTPILKHKAEAWFKHPHRLQYIDGTVFEPSTYLNGNEKLAVTNPKVLNLWEGFSVQPKAIGSWELLKSHILNVICCGDEQSNDYLLNWIARCFQRPDLNGRVAVVLKGKKGSGKGTLGNFLVSLFGQHAQHIINSNHLVGKFNAHMENCCFMFADEVFFAGDKAHENILKGMITEPTLLIERKGIDVIPAKNRLKILLSSNHDWVVPASADERRYFVLDVSSQYLNQPAYFNPLNAEIEKPENQAAFLYDMLHRDISAFEVSKYPNTKALKEQRAQSLHTFGQFWLEVLQRGYLYQSQETVNQSSFGVWINEVSTQLICNGYDQWCQNNKVGQYQIVSRMMIGKLLTNCYSKIYSSDKSMILGENKKGEIIYNQTRVHGYKLGTWQEAIRLFCENQNLDESDLLQNLQLQNSEFSHDSDMN